MLERDLEKACRLTAIERKFMLIKLVSPGFSGIPDRLLIDAIGGMSFVELKTETGRLSKLQQAVHNKLRSHNCHVTVIRNLQQFGELLDAYERSVTPLPTHRD